MEDSWCEDWGVGVECLFPPFFALAANKEVTMVDVWDDFRNEGAWSPCFNTLFNDWEVEDLQRFLAFLEGKRVVLGREDVLV